MEERLKELTRGAEKSFELINVINTGTFHQERIRSYRVHRIAVILGKKMAMLLDPTIRFLAVPGSVSGVCPRCKHHGPIGKFCYQCCHEEGMMIGTCPDCEECGPIGNLCVQCGTSKYVDEVPVGTCSQCGGEGIRHTLCSGCEDQSRLYE